MVATVLAFVEFDTVLLMYMVAIEHIDQVLRHSSAVAASVSLVLTRRRSTAIL